MIINNERSIIIKKFYHNKSTIKIFIPGQIKNFLRIITIHLDKCPNKFIIKTNIKQKCNKTILKILWMAAVCSVWPKVILQNSHLQTKIIITQKLHIFLKYLLREKIISSQQSKLNQVLTNLIITKIIIKRIK